MWVHGHQTSILLLARLSAWCIPSHSVVINTKCNTPNVVQPMLLLLRDATSISRLFIFSTKYDLAKSICYNKRQTRIYNTDVQAISGESLLDLWVRKHDCEYDCFSSLKSTLEDTLLRNGSSTANVVKAIMCIVVQPRRTCWQCMRLTLHSILYR